MRFLISVFAVLVVMFFSGAEVLAGNWLDKARDAFVSKDSGGVLDALNGGGASVGNLTNSEMTSGLREALRIGTTRVVDQIGVRDGFNLDKHIHISLPGTLGKVDKALSSVGMGALTEDLELRLNRAAEVATPKAKALFVKAITEMTIDDAKSILTGPENSATQYLRKSMGSELSKEMNPIVEGALAEAGAIQAYDQVIGRYEQMPFMPDVKANLQSYVVEKAMDGIFYYVGKEEAAIRRDPAKRTTDILKRVFSATGG